MYDEVACLVVFKAHGIWCGDLRLYTCR